MVDFKSIMNFNGTKSLPFNRKEKAKGSVLVPCMLFLSLMAVLSIGFLNITKIETKISENWNNDYAARLAANSAKEVALLKLKTDITYTGEMGMIFPDTSGSSDISITTPFFLGREVTCNGKKDTARYDLRVMAKLYPRQFKYALAVCDELEFKDSSMVLGDLYVNDRIRADSTSKVDGTVDLAGDRTILKNLSEKPVSVDGDPLPSIEEEVSNNNIPLQPIGWDLGYLKTLAQGMGQVYSSNQKFENQDFYGVVYLTAGINAEFKNVSIHGVLVAEPAIGSPQVFDSAGGTDSELIVKSNYNLKVISDPAIMENLAIIAPASNLKVEGNSVLETLGCVVAGFLEYQGNSAGSMTGPTLVNGRVDCDGDWIFQSSMLKRDQVPIAIVFPEYDVEEIEYTEP